MIKRRSIRGFTLIEVLIALVVLTVGLLGMAILMLTSLQSSQGAYMRSQASLLAYDIVERMRTNYTQAINTNDYALDASADDPAEPDCADSETGCDAAGQAELDMFQWRTTLSSSIPGSSATISRSNENEYQIDITWSEAGEQLVDSNGNELAASFSLRVNL